MTLNTIPNNICLAKIDVSSTPGLPDVEVLLFGVGSWKMCHFWKIQADFRKSNHTTLIGMKN